MCDPEPRTLITPETKVGALLEAYPDLEETLIGLVPEFKKLRNPILKKTLARVTSLRQAAAVGRIPLADLINALRAKAGGDVFETEPGDDESEGEAPEWLSAGRVVESIDARPVLGSGGHPMVQVLAACKGLKRGEILEIITPFKPAPLLDAAGKQGFLTWSKEEDGLYKSYFTPQP